MSVIIIVSPGKQVQLYLIVMFIGLFRSCGLSGLITSPVKSKASLHRYYNMDMFRVNVKEIK